MADNRINQALENIVNGEPFDNPRTDDEVMLSKIAAGEEVTENARNRFQYWLKQIEAGGGENPNYVETINGTIENPWGTYSLSELVTMMNLKSATVYMTTEGWQDLLLCPTGDYVECSRVQIFSSSAADTSGIYLEYNIQSGDLTTNFNVYDGEYGSNPTSSQTILTVIHHPMPEVTT